MQFQAEKNSGSKSVGSTAAGSEQCWRSRKSSQGTWYSKEWTSAGTESFCAEQGRGIIDSEGGDEEDMLNPIASDVVTSLSNVSVKKVP